MSEDPSAGPLKGALRQHPVAFGAMLGICTTLAVAGLSLTETFRTLELKTYDLRLKLWPSIPTSDRIVMVDIDDATMAALVEWPIPREKHAAVVRLLSEAGARQIVLDIEFLDTSRPTLSREELDRIMGADIEEVTAGDVVNDLRTAVVDHDGALADALDACDRVYLPFSLDTTDVYSSEMKRWYGQAKQILVKDLEIETEDLAKALGVSVGDVRDFVATLKRRVIREFLAEHHTNGTSGVGDVCAAMIPAYRADVATPEREWVRQVMARRVATGHVKAIAALSLSHAENVHLWQELNPPTAVLARHVRHSGYVNIEPDRLDGTVRRVRLASRFGNKLYLQLALRATLDFLQVPPSKIDIDRDWFRFPVGDRTIAIPLDADGMALVNWAGGRGVTWRDTFLHISFLNVLRLWEERERLDEWLLRHWPTTFVKLKADPRTTREEMVAAAAELIRGLRRTLDLGRKRVAREDDFGKIAAMREQLSKFEQNLVAYSEMERRCAMGARWLRGQLQDKICIIGHTARSSTDLKPTPLHPRQPGVTLHANIINMVLQRRFLRECSAAANITIIICWGMASTIAALRGSARENAIETVALVAANCAIAILLFGVANVSIGLVSPLLAQLLSFSAVTTYRQLTEERTKREVRTAFEHYLNPAVVEQVATDPDKLRLGGEMRELTILFSDIQGFSAVSESMAPPQLVEWLNEYLSEMSQTIIDNGGCVDKYEGDLIMAFFGAPLDMPDHAARACLTMLENRDKLVELRKRWDARGLPPIYARVGVNTAEVLVGNLGSRTRLNYSVIGDGVNLAARLEPANKIYGTYLMVSEATYEQARDVVVARELDLLRVLGRAKPVRVYELIGRQGAVGEDTRKALEFFADGLAFHRERQWEKAIDALRQVLTLIPGDPPSQSLIGRCEEYLDMPPSPNWDGSFSQTSKE